MEQKNIGGNLKRIREAKGLSQAQMAEFADISRIAYRNIENGTSIPKVSTLQSIASGVDVKLQDLLKPVRTLERVRFRASKKMNSRDRVLIEVARWLDDYNDLENILNESKKDYKFESLKNILSTINMGDQRAKYAAKKARIMLGLKPKELIRDIAGLLEDAGIKLYPLILVSDEFFGLSVAEDDGGPAIIVNVWERISVERWIFSAAHELGHLLLHFDTYDISDSTEDIDQEKEADIFASYFLMPDEVFKGEWEGAAGLPLVQRVFKVKHIFRVSYKTVLYRLSKSTPYIWGKFYASYKVQTGKSLGPKDEPEALFSDNFIRSPEVLRSKEPDSLSQSYFVEDRLYRLVREAIEDEEITMSRGAEILRLDLITMRDIVSSWV
ncbi:MAG: XRE family transcriptional regulator [Syntrophomonadaceae bacterium]|nr:XRE family transcriptional regulator [Syntrophomonadaceae bacterium]MDD4550397.1 XRE family transcriptional regulator [Syntrophomonadaceae bacterium]